MKFRGNIMDIIKILKSYVNNENKRINKTI